MFTAALFIIARTWKQPRCPLTDEWIKMRYTHTRNYYSTVKKNETRPFLEMWMDLENVIKVKSERENKIWYINTYM